MTSDVEKDRKVARTTALAADLLASWPEERAAFEAVRGVRPADLLAVYGLASQAHYLASTALAHFRDQDPLVAAPLVRLAFECSLTAHWIAQTRDATHALMNEERRQRRNILVDLERAGVPLLDHERAEQAATDELDTTAGDQARWIQKLCAEFETDIPLYYYFRSLSQFCHSSVAVVNEWIDSSGGGDPVLLSKPRGTHDFWVALLGYSLVWAGRALDFFDANHRRRAELRQAAKSFGISAELQLTFQAQVRSGRPRRR